MTDEEFEQYLQASLEEMEEKQAKLETEFRIGHFERFAVDYEASCLSFYDGEEKKIEVKITPVASHVPDKENLKWAWANESYPQAVRESASFTKELGELTGFEMFANGSVECDENMAWEINAMACKLTNALGVYRVPHGHINVHVVINEVTKCG